MSLCHDIIFLCRDRVLVKARRFFVTTVYFRSRQTLAKIKRISCCDKVFCVKTGCGQKTKGPCVATKQFVSWQSLAETKEFYVAT